MSGFFITGTDTGIGKTFITCALIHALRQRGMTVAPMKPIAAGTIVVNGVEMNEDVALFMAATNHRYAVADINPYCFAEPIAPHLAAMHDGAHIDIDVIHGYHTTGKFLADTTNGNNWLCHHQPLPDFSGA